MTVEIRRHRFSVHDYHCMAKEGILGEDDRIELIEGEIVEMAPIGSRHAAQVSLLGTRLGQKVVPDQCIIRIQSPVRLSPYSEPEPDIALVRAREDFYKVRHPSPDEVILLIEVADSSLAYDRDLKSGLYARWGVGEYWLIDLNDTAVHVFRGPSVDGYATHAVLRGSDLLTCIELPFLLLRVDEILIG